MHKNLKIYETARRTGIVMVTIDNYFPLLQGRLEAPHRY